MKHARRDLALVGAFVVVMSCVLVGALLWLAGANVFRRVDRYYIVFDRSVSGLAPGGTVEFQGVPVTAENYQSLISSLLSVDMSTASAIATYFYPASRFDSPALALSQIGTDSVFACPSRTFARYLSEYAPTFAYEFGDENAPQDVLPPASFPYGSYHGAEVQYLLDGFDAAPAFTSEQTQLASHMKSYWTQFAKTGDPNGGSSPVWTKYVHGAETSLQRLVAPTPEISGESHFVYDHSCVFWSGH